MAQKVGSDGQVRKSAAAWAADTRIYDQGTRLFNTGDIDDDSDATKFKLADGFHAWADLEYFSPGSGGGGGIAAVNATAPLTASGTTTRTIAATTSEGGNGATDNGKILVFGPDGSISGSSATGSGVVGTGNAGPGVKGTSVEGTAIRADNLDLSSAGHIFEGANKDGLKITVLNDGSIAIADDAAKAATRASLGVPNVYFATLSNLGAITVDSSYNQLGGTPAWATVGGGEYTLTITGAFTAGKTFVTCTPRMIGAVVHLGAAITSADVITVYARDVDGGLADPTEPIYVKVEIYP